VQGSDGSVHKLWKSLYDLNKPIPITEKRMSESDIEYIKAPTVKMFKNEKPTKEGWYLISEHKLFIPYHITLAYFKNEKFIPNPCWQALPYNTYWWCEIILPSEV